MKFIIFICSRIQHGEYPRLPEFPYSEELGKYIYQGRELTLEEFNTAAAIVFDKDYRSSGYSFCPLAIDPEAEAKAAAEQAARIAEETAAAEAEANRLAEEAKAGAATDDTVINPDGRSFLLDGKNIFFEGQHVAGLFGDNKQLRVLSAHAGLRPEIEAWLLTTTPSDP